MRGMGTFQMAQMKHRDARVHAMFSHLKHALDIMERIASEPFGAPEPKVEPLPPAPLAPRELPPQKLAYNAKEACAALGIGRTTLHAAIREGRLRAVKLGSRTIISTDAIRDWIDMLPPRGAQ